MRRSVSDWLKRMSDNSRLTTSTRSAVDRLRRRRANVAAAVGERDQVGVLAFEMAQDVLQPVLDPAEIAGAGIGGGLQAARADTTTRCSRWANADALSLPTCMRSMRSDSARMRAFEMFGVVACRRAARGFPASSSARQCAARALANASPWLPSGAGQLIDLGRQRMHVFGQAAPARRWRRRWRRSSEAPRSRLRADEPWTDRRSRAGSDRAWRRDCGSRRHSRRVARPASASAALRGFRPARVRCRPAPGRRCRSGGCRRCGAYSERISFSIDSIARRGIASVMA